MLYTEPVYYEVILEVVYQMSYTNPLLLILHSMNGDGGNNLRV